MLDSQEREPGQVKAQTETIISMPYDLHSSTIALGSGHACLLKLQSPMIFQWNQSITMTSTGTERLWKPRAAVSSSSCEA